MAKSFADWQARAKQLGWSPAQYSLAAYKGTPHYAQGGSTAAPAAPAPAAPAPSSGPKKFTVDGVEYPIRKSGSLFGNNPNKGYKARATLESGTRGGNRISPGPIGGINLYMTKNGKRAFQHNSVGYVETEPGSGKFRSTVGSEDAGDITISEWTHREPEKPAAPPPPKPSHSGGGSVSTPKPSYAPVGGGPTSSASVNNQITATQQALNAAIAAINAQATGYNTAMQSFANSFSSPAETTGPVWPGAPAWVKTFDDYRKWKRQQSAETGYLSTINTSSTGLTDEEAMKNVVVTALTG